MEHDARRHAAKEYEARRDEADQRAELALSTARRALEDLTSWHAEVAERYRFGIGAYTRWSALWELSAVALGYADAMLYLLEGGRHLQMAPGYRSVHEALGLLSAFLQPEEDDLLRKFLDNRKMSSGDGHGALKRDVTRMREDKRAAGVTSETVQINEQAGKLYGALSEASHMRRGALGDFVDARLRRAYIGQHDDPQVRAELAEAALLVMEQVAMLVGAALNGIELNELKTERSRAIVNSITAVTHDQDFIARATA